MSWLNLAQISEMLCGCLRGHDAAVTGVSIDSRKISTGDLFIALSGERFDGHDFADQAMEAGAAGLVVARKLALPVPQIIVQDTLQALWDLAHEWRKRINLQMIALTGSNGKTTTKEMLFSIFRQKEKTLATCNNFNNHIGVPLTLLNLRRQHTVGIVEIGANHAGEVSKLAQLVKPDIGLVTNATAAHLQGFGSVDDVARAKGEMFETLSPQATGIVNIDSPYYGKWCSLLGKHRVVSFGLSNDADVCGHYDEKISEFTLEGRSYAVKLQMPGVHNFCNALAAVATAHAAGVKPDVIVLGLEACTAVPGRLNLLSGIQDICVIDDSYNANPASVDAALEVLQSYPQEKWMVLGDMQELGIRTDALHAAVGNSAKSHGIDCLFTVGKFTTVAVEAFGDKALHFDTTDLLIQHLIDAIHPNLAILVKGSRTAQLEQVVSVLTGRDKRC